MAGMNNFTVSMSLDFAGGNMVQVCVRERKGERAREREGERERGKDSVCVCVSREKLWCGVCGRARDAATHCNTLQHAATRCNML